MTRFGLVIDEDDAVFDEDSVNNDGELVYSSDEDGGDDDDSESEPAHPLGFSNCRYGLLSNNEILLRKPKKGRGLMDDLYGSDDEAEMNVRVLTPLKQQFPPIESYIDASVIPTKDLIRYTMEDHKREDRNDEDTISHLLMSAATLSASKALSLPSTTPIQSIIHPYQLMQSDTLRIKREMDQERSKIAQKNAAAVQGLKTVLRHYEEEADKVRKEQARLDAAADEAKRTEERKQQEEKEKEEQIRATQQKQVEEKRERQRQQQEALAAQEEAAKAAAAKEMEFILRAEKLMAQLKQVRESASTFEASTAASVKTRRLQMKKLVGGRVNTLAENVDKIRSVASDVAQAITVARDDDEIAKQQLEAGNPSFTREMGRGKRYLLDLLCSKVMVRVQSEGFNGQRGDGFPLANMLALVSADHKDLSLLLEAHIYTECPTAIPRLPSLDSDASEEELMTALGMKQNSDGTSETFKRFLDRTESIISVVADIMSSKPENHTLFGGHGAAIRWLSRFLSALPDAPAAPLPLLTAPVLDAFLTGAGHMLANLHEEAFKPLLDSIMRDIIQRLDEGPIGAPSATRLKKTVHAGFDGFKRNLPHKALPELYNAGGSSGVGGGSFARSGPFGVSQQSSSAQPLSTGSQPSFGVGGGQSTSSNNPFGSPFGSSTAVAPAPSPFGQSNFASQGLMNTDNTGQSTNPPPFGGSSSTASPFDVQSGNQMSSPFGSPSFKAGLNNQAASPSAPFGAPNTFGTQSGNSGGTFGSSSTASTPFSYSPSTQTAGTSATSSSLFGSGISTPFGSAGSSASPFGGGNAPSTFGTDTSSSSTPFGGGAGQPTPFGGTAAGQSSPFGGTNANQPSPFGGGAATGQSAPFGGGAATTQSTPFGGVAAPSTPFRGGVPAASTPFGGGIPATTTFGGSTGPSAPFGAGSSNNNMFGGSTSTPFGGASSLSAPFGAGLGNSGPTPFGGGMSNGVGQQQQQQSNSAGFGQPQTGGGFGQPQGGGGGGGRGKPACKFFAKGSCRFGDNCRFSHDLSNNGGNGGGGGFGGNQNASGGFGSNNNAFQPSSYSNPFGGPRR